MEKELEQILLYSLFEEKQSGPKKVEDLVYVQFNLSSMKDEGYKKRKTRLWDIGKDIHHPLDDVVDFMNRQNCLFLNQTLKPCFSFLDDGNWGEESDTISIRQ